MWIFASSRILRLILAPALSLWVAGAGCMLACEGLVASAATLITAAASTSEEGSQIVASGHACSSGEMAKSHDCCKGAPKAEADTRREPHEIAFPAATESQSRTMNGCPLAVSRAAVVSKTRTGDASDSTVPAQSLIQSNITLEQTAPLSPPLRLPNRGHTYLRCCVFLI
jgi:hypothetical protein